MLDIKAEHFKIVQEILQKYPYRFYVFGSRAKGLAKRLSDLDLCFFDSIPSEKQSELEDEFEKSDLPYKVDLVAWDGCDEEFREEIRKDMIPFPLSNQKADDS